MNQLQTSSLKDLYKAFKAMFPNGLPEKVSSSLASLGNFTSDAWQQYEGDVESLDDLYLPFWIQELREAISVDDASAGFFKLCIGLFECGCTFECITETIEQLTWLPERYEGRLESEVERCLSKYDLERYVVSQEPFSPLGQDAGILDIRLSETDELFPEYRESLEKYCELKRIC